MVAGGYDQRVQDLLGDAEAAAAQDDWKSVRDLAGAVMALAPGHPDAEALLGRADQAAPAGGERRQLTVMFCDVVGSTPMSQELDPELLREVLRSYQVTCDRVVRRYDGRIARFIGDGILAYFGHPVVHEDDARRAVKAGLDMLEALRPVTDEIQTRYGVDFRVRVAVHTGLVVRADMGSAATPDRDAIVGDTPNIAARLQDQAAPGTLLISHDTFELVRGWFLVTPRGELSLKGIDAPVRAYEVVDELTDLDRVHAQADLTPFVGRAEELEALVQAWDDVCGGAFRSVALSGPPGVGKSRLADVVCRRVEADGGTSLLVPCSSMHGATALYPVRRLLERVAGIEQREDPEVSLAKLWSAMDGVGLAERLPVVASLLELPPTSWCPAPQLDGPRLREHLLATLVEWVRAVTERGALLLVVDDLQWADPSTAELLARVTGEAVPRLLLMATIRDDAKLPWPSATVIAIDRLTADQLGELARRSPDGRRLDEAQLEQLIERSDGIPLYLEELLRNTALAGAGARAESRIPAALRDLLLARFAAPGVDLALAQTLATIGSEASLPLVAAVTGLDGPSLDFQMGALVEAGIVDVVPGSPPGYRFRHHLLGELAYETQLQATRRQLHGAVADALTAGRPDIQAPAPSVLAYHFEQAGRLEEAVRFLASAARDAHALGANAEVTELLTRAMELLGRVADDERPMLELEVRLIRATNASSILGFAAPQAVEDYSVCRELVAARAGNGGFLDDPDTEFGHEVVSAASGLWATFLLQGQIDDAAEVNRSLVAQLRPGGSLHDQMARASSFIDFFRGDYHPAVEGLEAAHRSIVEGSPVKRAAIPSDTRVTSLAHLGFALGVQCRFDAARERCEQAIELAAGLPFPVGPFSLCYALSLRSSLELVAEEVDGARHFATELASLADRHGYTFWGLIAGQYHAHLDLHAGVDGAVDQCEAALTMLQAVGVHVWTPYYRAGVAAIHLRAGDTEAAAASLATAAEVAERAGAHFWSAEIARLDGELRLLRDDATGVERLRDAIELAERQGAVLHELRARIALARSTGDRADLAGLGNLLATAAAGAPDSVVSTAREVLAAHA